MMTRSRRRIPQTTTPTASPTASPTAPAPSLSICRCYRYKIVWVLCGSFIAGYCFYQQLHPIGSLLVQRGIMAQQVKPSSSSSSSSRGGGATNTTLNTNTTSTTTTATIYDSDDNGDNDDVYVVADPTLLKRKRREFLFNNNNNNNDDYSSSSSNFFKTLKGYYPFIIDNNNENENENNMQSAAAPSAIVCNMTGGYGLEDYGGWELLTKKVRVYNNLPDDEDQDDERIMAGEKEKQLQRFPRILCMIYTHYPMRHLARTAALTYGYKCDGFLAFTSNETIPELGFVALQHDGIESYHNMWQKVRSIWKYVGTHYLDKYDYFHLGGDDMYVIPNNLRRFLSMAEERERENHHHQQQRQNETYPNPPAAAAAFYYGQWVRQKAGPIIAGGPGYTLNNVAVKLFVRDALPTCFKDKVAPYEDRLMSLCLRSVLHIGPSDTRDYVTAEQMYHDVPPHQVYVSRPPPSSPSSTTNNSTGRRRRRPTFHSRGQAYWETLPYPNSTFVYNNDKKNLTSAAAAEGGGVATVAVGPKYGLDAAATYSVSFHNLYTPMYMARIHAILYPGTCPKTTTTSPSLGQSLQQQLLIQRNQQQQENQNEEEHQQQ